MRGARRNAANPAAGGYHESIASAPGSLLGMALVMAVAAAGCGRLAVWSAPAKTPTTARTAAAVEADTLFWKTLHAGEYDRIPDALTALKAAYLENPRDAITAAHVGWLHIWRLGERARQTALRPDITDDAVLAPEVLRGSGAARSRRGAIPRLLRRAADGRGHHPQGREDGPAGLLRDAGRGPRVARVQLLHRRLHRLRPARRIRPVPRRRSSSSG